MRAESATAIPKEKVYLLLFEDLINDISIKAQFVERENSAIQSSNTNEKLRSRKTPPYVGLHLRKKL